MSLNTLTASIDLAASYLSGGGLLSGAPSLDLSMANIYVPEGATVHLIPFEIYLGGSTLGTITLSISTSTSIVSISGISSYPIAGSDEALVSYNVTMCETGSQDLYFKGNLRSTNTMLIIADHPYGDTIYVDVVDNRSTSHPLEETTITVYPLSSGGVKQVERLRIYACTSTDGVPEMPASVEITGNATYSDANNTTQDLLFFLNYVSLWNGKPYLAANYCHLWYDDAVGVTKWKLGFQRGYYFMDEPPPGTPTSYWTNSSTADLPPLTGWVLDNTSEGTGTPTIDYTPITPSGELELTFSGTGITTTVLSVPDIYSGDTCTDVMTKVLNELNQNNYFLSLFYATSTIVSGTEVYIDIEKLLAQANDNPLSFVLADDTAHVSTTPSTSTTTVNGSATGISSTYADLLAVLAPYSHLIEIDTSDTPSNSPLVVSNNGPISSIFCYDPFTYYPDKYLMANGDRDSEAFAAPETIPLVDIEGAPVTLASSSKWLFAAVGNYSEGILSPTPMVVSGSVCAAASRVISTLVNNQMLFIPGGDLAIVNPSTLIVAPVSGTPASDSRIKILLAFYTPAP